MRKGLSELMYLVITIIILLIAGVIVVTVFGNQLSGAADPTTVASQQCKLRCSSSCIGQQAGAEPPGWGAQSVGNYSCSTLLVEGCKC